MECEDNLGLALKDTPFSMGPMWMHLADERVCYALGVGISDDLIILSVYFMFANFINLGIIVFIVIQFNGGSYCDQH